MSIMEAIIEDGLCVTVKILKLFWLIAKQFLNTVII